MSYKLNIEVGNFVSLFDGKEMLENFQERIWPFLKSKKPISFGRGEDKDFLFYNFKIIERNEEWYVCGSIIRNMKLKSVQNYNKETENLIKRNKSLDDSPSIYIIIRLVDHKLLLIKETTRAPGIGLTEKYFAKAFKVHRKLLNDRELKVYKRRLNRTRLTQIQKIDFYDYFEANFPIVQFRITPIASYRFVKKAFEHMSEVNSLTVTLHHTNTEDPDFRTALMKQLKESKSQTGSGNTTSIKTQIVDNKIGIKKNSVIDIASDVTKSGGNASFKAEGIDNSGTKMTVKDNELSIKDFVEVEDTTNEELKIIEGIKKLDQHAGSTKGRDDLQELRGKLNLLIQSLFRENV